MTISEIDAAALKMYKKDMIYARDKARKAREKEKAKISASIKQLEDYPTRKDVDDAYGYDMITSKKRDELLQLLEANEDQRAAKLDEETATTRYIYFLSKDIESLDYNIEALEAKVKEGI